MNEDQVKGVGEKVKGKINEGVGKMTDDPAQEAKGDAQQIAGEARKQVGTPNRMRRTQPMRRWNATVIRVPSHPNRFGLTTIGLV